MQQYSKKKKKKVKNVKISELKPKCLLVKNINNLK